LEKTGIFFLRGLKARNIPAQAKGLGHEVIKHILKPWMGETKGDRIVTPRWGWENLVVLSNPRPLAWAGMLYPFGVFYRSDKDYSDESQNFLIPN